MSLRAKFLALFAAFAVLPLIAIGVFDYIYSMRALEALIATQVDEIATRAAAELRGSYALRQSELLLLADNAETQRLYQALGGDDAGTRNAALAGADSYLRQAWNVLGHSYGWIEFRDADGATVYRLPPGNEDRTIDFDEAQVPYPSNWMTVERPIYDAAGSGPIGTLHAALDLESLLPYEQLAARFGETGYSTVVDRSRGIVVYHPSHAYRDQSLNALTGSDGWDIDPKTIDSNRGQFSYREGDTTRVAAFASLAQPPWTMIASGSVAEFAAPFHRMRTRILALILVVAVAVATVFTWMTRRETRSLLALTAAADQVGAGNFTPPLPPAAVGEVGRLTDAFGLMVAKLRETLRQIEASRQMAVVGEFASQVSHEIRNPLTSLKLNLQSLDRDVRAGHIPEQSARPIEIALREIERLEQVVSGVLSLGRPRSTARAAASMHEVLNDALELMQAQLDQQRIDVQVDYRADDDVVVANAEEVKAAFLNLFLNGAEAMPDGGTLRIGTTRLERPGRVEIRVADEGPGISDALREEIFRPFYSTKEKGTGLGLSLALRTVEEHGGALAVAEPATAGSGAEFVVTLPLEAEAIRS
ncbi:MAG: ATP-binding protein [Gemmatimonadales bacterium]|jgi:signal transduction histidine kinase